MPPLVKLPENTVMTLSPRLFTWSSTCLVAPVVRLTEPITAPTPMIMPSIVSKERILFRRKARPAILSEAKIRMITFSGYANCTACCARRNLPDSESAISRSATNSSVTIAPSRKITVRLV